MTRSAIVVAVMSAAGMMALYSLDESAKNEDVTKEFRHFDAATTKLVVEYQCFKSSLVSALKDLQDRRVGLAEATDRVYSAARVHCPVYLERIKISDGGITEQHCVARNLVAHLISIEEETPGLRKRVAALENELEVMRREIERENKGA